jgi:hypothetical protein
VPRPVAVEAGALHPATNPDPAVTLSAGQGGVIESTAVATLRHGGGGPRIVLLGTIIPSGSATARG